jgi:hypothetical protein
LRVLASKAARQENFFCNPDCYYKSRQGWESTYRYRGLEASPKQKLVRFLVSHGIGENGTPGEQTIIHVKSGFYVPGLSPHDSPLALLAHDLQQLGHHKLANMVLDGSWQDESKWLCYAEGWIRRKPKQYP